MSFKVKFVLLAISIFATTLNGKFLYGCGSTEELARDNYAYQHKIKIKSSIQTSIDINSSSSKGDKFNKQIKTNSKQSASAKIVNPEYFEKDGMICVREYQKKVFEFLLSFSSPADGNKYIKDTYNLEMNILFVAPASLNSSVYSDYLKYGFGFMIGSDTTKLFSNSSTKLLELYAIVGLQVDSDLIFKYFKIKYKPQIKSIPYVRIKLGAGYHEYSYKQYKIAQYPTSGDSDAKSGHPEDFDKTDFIRDYIIFKPVVGVDFLVVDGLYFKLFLEKSFNMDKRWKFGGGAVYEF